MLKITNFHCVRIESVVDGLGIFQSYRYKGGKRTLRDVHPIPNICWESATNHNRMKTFFEEWLKYCPKFKTPHRFRAAYYSMSHLREFISENSLTQLRYNKYAVYSIFLKRGFLTDDQVLFFPKDVISKKTLLGPIECDSFTNTLEDLLDSVIS